jgi:adenylate cyclase
MWEPTLANPIILRGDPIEAGKPLIAVESIERRLMALLTADMVGYSHMTAKDEEGTIRRLNQLRRQTIDPLIQRYRCRIVKTTGDGMLNSPASLTSFRVRSTSNAASPHEIKN